MALSVKSIVAVAAVASLAIGLGLYGLTGRAAGTSVKVDGPVCGRRCGRIISAKQPCT